jgi:hypothetical protein
VVITMTPTVAAARPRTLSTVTNAQWCTQGPAQKVRDQAAFVALHPNHNSIPAISRQTVIATNVVPAPAGGVGYGATEQAAPPRGVPR